MATNITINKGYKLFPGANQYERYMKCFHKVVNANSEAFKVHGIGPGDLGSNSTWKGACSHASAGSVSPPIVSICLQAMWSMGSVKKRYLHYDKAGDQYLVQTVDRLNCNHHLFAVSPPYFDYWLLDEDGRNTMERQIHELVSNCLFCGDEVDPRVFCIFLSYFASVCYHSTFLKERLRRTNRLHASPFFTHIPADILPLAVVKYPWNKTEDTPNFTGIPPHVSLLAEMQGMQEDLKMMKEDLNISFCEEMDGRGNGSEGYFNTKSLVDRMKIMERLIVAKLDGRNGKPKSLAWVSTSDDALLGFDTSNAIDITETWDTRISVASGTNVYNFLWEIFSLICHCRY